MNLQQHLRSERALRLAGLVACGVLLFLAGLIMCPPMQENEADAATGQPTPATSSVTLSIADGPLSFDLKPISSDGTFAESTTMTITASTNSFSGYTLSIAAQSGDNTTKLINTDTEKCPVTETKCSIASLSGVVTKNAYADPVDSTAVEAVRNTWGFSPSEYLDGETSIDNSATDGTLRDGFMLHHPYIRIAVYISHCQPQFFFHLPAVIQFRYRRHQQRIRQRICYREEIIDIH